MNASSGVKLYIEDIAENVMLSSFKNPWKQHVNIAVLNIFNSEKTSSNSINVFTGWACHQRVVPPTWVLWCDLEPSPWLSDNNSKGKKHINSGCLNAALDWAGGIVAYLCHLHGYTFREVPLDVFKVNLCCAASYMRQLQNKRRDILDS